MWKSSKNKFHTGEITTAEVKMVDLVLNVRGMARLVSVLVGKAGKG